MIYQCHKAHQSCKLYISHVLILFVHFLFDSLLCSPFILFSCLLLRSSCGAAHFAPPAAHSQKDKQEQEYHDQEYRVEDEYRNEADVQKHSNYEAKEACYDP